jgi:hypothetical protein
MEEEKNNSEWGNCPRCGNRINHGSTIESDEKLVCESCADKHELFIVGELNKFRLSKDFSNKISLRKKILWSSEQLGHWFDAGDKSYIENVSDYDDKNIFQLQIYILDAMQTLLENYIYPELEIDYSNKYPELEKLRLEVREQQRRIASYLDKKIK